MAIVTVSRIFGDDTLPVKAIELPKYPNLVKISMTQLELVCPNMLFIDVIVDNDGKEYGLFHKTNVNFQ